MIRPGYEQQHLSGEAAFCSFVPVSLQEVVQDGVAQNADGNKIGQNFIEDGSGDSDSEKRVGTELMDVVEQQSATRERQSVAGERQSEVVVRQSVAGERQSDIGAQTGEACEDPGQWSFYLKTESDDKQSIAGDGSGSSVFDSEAAQPVTIESITTGSFSVEQISAGIGTNRSAGKNAVQQGLTEQGMEQLIVGEVKNESSFINDGKAAEGWLFHPRVRGGAERVAALVEELNRKWESLEEQKRYEMEERFLRAEAEQSVMLAYPVKPEDAQGDCPGGGETGPGSANEGRFSAQESSEGISLDLLMLQTLSSAEKQYTLADVPDEFRWMAEMDYEHLYHAAKKGLELLERLPLSGRLLKEIHYIALYGPHYDKLYRGEFRSSPVWIGLPDGNLHSAEFVPPVEEAMLDAFSEMEKFIHYEEETDPLIKAVLLHYQFETIHPFLDGNGRMGRLLVQLYLREFCGLQMPWIPLSRVLIRGMDRYYRELRLVQTTGDYFRWTCWFTGILKDALEAALQELQR